MGEETGETGGEVAQKEEADGGGGKEEEIERKVMNMSFRRREDNEEGRWARMEGDERKSRAMEKAGEEDRMST